MCCGVKQGCAHGSAVFLFHLPSSCVSVSVGLRKMAFDTLRWNSACCPCRGDVWLYRRSGIKNTDIEVWTAVWFGGWQGLGVQVKANPCAGWAPLLEPRAWWRGTRARERSHPPGDEAVSVGHLKVHRVLLSQNHPQLFATDWAEAVAVNSCWVSALITLLSRGWPPSLQHLMAKKSWIMGKS